MLCHGSAADGVWLRDFRCLQGTKDSGSTGKSPRFKAGADLGSDTPGSKMLPSVESCVAVRLQLGWKCCSHTHKAEEGPCRGFGGCRIPPPPLCPRQCNHVSETQKFHIKNSHQRNTVWSGLTEEQSYVTYYGWGKFNTYSHFATKEGERPLKNSCTKNIPRHSCVFYFPLLMGVMPQRHWLIKFIRF